MILKGRSSWDWGLGTGGSDCSSGSIPCALKWGVGKEIMVLDGFRYAGFNLGPFVARIRRIGVGMFSTQIGCIRLLTRVARLIR